MAEPERVVVTVIYDDGSQNVATMNISGPHPTNALTVGIDDDRVANVRVTAVEFGPVRTYDPSQPVALDDRDPGNTDPENLTAPLDADDDVYALINPEADK